MSINGPIKVCHSVVVNLSTSLVVIFLIILINIDQLSSSLSVTTITTNIDHDVITRCQQDCPHRMNVQDELDIACNSSCKIRLCKNGCHYWYLSPSACFQVCRGNHIDNDDNNELPKLQQSSIMIENGFGDRDNYCALGCNHAHTVYIDHVKLLLETNGSLRPPRLVPNSLSNDSLKIEWNQLHESLRTQINISYRIQWKYQNLPSQWMYIGAAGVRAFTDISNDQTNILHINGLNAYTSYLFRIEWILASSLHESIITESSEPFTTLPYGVPKSACIIVSCMAISPNQISVNWRAPAFPNGPIIAYSLYLYNEHTGRRTVKDIHTHWDPFRTSNLAIHSYVFNDLQSDTNYTVSIVTHNNFGEGIRCWRQISTPKQSEEIDDEELEMKEYMHYKLYLASSKSVARRNVDFLLDEEILYHLTDYVENGDITGMAVHFNRRYIFVADSSGTIRRIWLKENSINQVLRIINGSNQPSHLSIDWLNDRLYWLEEPANRVMRSNLDGENIESIYISSFQPNQKPIDFKVDPYNGYLFWIQSNMFNRTAIYRLDLCHLNGPIRSGNSNALRSKIELIYQSDSWISTFAINYLNYRLLFPMTHTASIHSITIDGNDETTIRDNAIIAGANRMEISPFAGMDNMVIYNQRLYFSRAENITWEEYHVDEQMYYHNTYTTESRLISLAIMDQQSQPIPVPLTPVEAVEAVFLDTSARISWQKPALFGTSGRGAWQQWRYEVAIQESDNPQVVHTAKVNNITQCDAVELQPDTGYEIRVRAFTSAGNGAWSNKFIGRTLPSMESMTNRPYALIATKDRLLIRTELDGKFKQQLLPKSKLDTLGVNNITGVYIYKDSVVLNTDQHILLYGSLTVEHSTLTVVVNKSNAHSIAVEWMAPKIYWSNPLERMICRCNMDGSQIEILPIITYAQEIAIDSINGFLYWSTSSSLRIARLNGMKNSQRLLLRTQQIKSLSIDQKSGRLYWTTVRSLDKTNTEESDENILNQDGNIVMVLHHIDLFETIDQINEINLDSEHVHSVQLARQQSNNLIGPIASFARRFWWLNTQQNQMVVSDDHGQTFATIRQNTGGISTFQIVTDNDDQRDRRFEIDVVPKSVDENSIQIQGTWENFTIKWNPVTNVNYGQVFYDLSLENDEDNAAIKQSSTNNNLNHFILNQTEFILPEHLKPSKPYAQIRIALRSFTYWASSRQVVATLHTPSSIPSKPRSVRVFTYVMNDSDKLNPKRTKSEKRFAAEARWLEPENPNGLIQSYTISLWTMDTGNVTKVTSIINKVIPNQLWYRLEDLKPNATYYFEVRATTYVGEGPPSQVIQFKTYRSEPPLRLLLAERDSIYEADMDLKQIVRSVIKSLSPSLMDYNFAENRLYFVEDGNFLKCSKLIQDNDNNDEDDEIVRPLRSSNQVQSGQSGNYTILAHFTQSITSITMDWLGRRLYISTVDFFRNHSTIWCYTEETQTTRIVLTITGNYINTMRIDPYRSMLIWTQQPIKSKIPGKLNHESTFYMITAHRCRLAINGSACDERLDYFQSPSRDRLCNCTHTPNISGAFQLIHSLDQSIITGQRMIYFDRNGQTFIESSDGCYCRRITSFVETTNPPVAIELDQISSKLYWKNDSFNGLIYSTELDSEHDSDFRQPIKIINLAKPIRNMIQLSRQPYPYSLECLIPLSNIHLNMRMLRHTSTSLTLQIDLDRMTSNDIRSNNNCPSPIMSNQESIDWQPSLASIRFRIRYGLNRTDLRSTIDTFNQTIVIDNLEPFSNYSFSIEMDNFYLELIRNRSQHQLELAYNASLIPTLSNRIDYSDSIHRPYLYWDGFIFSTSESRPAPARNVRAIVESPERILVLWDRPERLNAKKVVYEVRCHSHNDSLDLQSWKLDDTFGVHHSLLNGSYWIHMDTIRPDTIYNITVRVYAIEKNKQSKDFYVDNHQFQDSESITIRSFPLPSDLQLKYLSARQIDLEWQAPFGESVIESHEIWFQSEPDINEKLHKNQQFNKNFNWTKFASDQTQSEQKYHYQFKHLKPYRWYRFRLELIYRPSRFRYEWPKSPKLFRIQTNMTVPDGPENLEIQTVHSKNDQQHEINNGINIYKIIWQPVRSNSDSQVYYQLYRWQITSQDDDNNNNNMINDHAINSSTQNQLVTNQHHSSKLAYNGTDNYWIVSGLQTGQQYHFRLYASNRLGVNQREYAQTIRPFWLGQPTEIDGVNSLITYPSSFNNGESHLFIIMFAIFCAVAVCLVIFSLCSLRFYKLNTKDVDSNNQSIISSSTNSHQIELIPWQQRPHPHLPNALYVNSSVQDVDLTDIEIFDYHSITLVKLLGKGAFGEVHEAILHKTEQRVAVKVLNKNSTKDEDQCNFLKEAKFMSKFKHPHILQLLGVCLNHHSSSIVIVLELMEAGDLLKYLRSNRPGSTNQTNKQPSTSISSSPLTIDDLMSICIDVAKGCEYLEQKQFVHRDLAARNCLVSSADREKRVVKIADFGLTRGLYQQNYYRKEGGLMPVRWMSPESLSDGVFTTQSDVWSYSVIMYEVMTLGQQPYQAYSNKEVLEFVKSGGILERPPLCSSQMYSLMKQCWKYETELRPSFATILQHLQQLRQSMQIEFEQMLKQQHSIKQRNRLTTVHNQNYQPIIDSIVIPNDEINSFHHQLDLTSYCNGHVKQQQPVIHQPTSIERSDPFYGTMGATSTGYIATTSNTTLTTLDDHNSLTDDLIPISSSSSITGNNNIGLTRILTMSPTLVLDSSPSSQTIFISRNNDQCNHQQQNVQLSHNHFHLRLPSDNYPNVNPIIMANQHNHNNNNHHHASLPLSGTTASTIYLKMAKESIINNNHNSNQMFGNQQQLLLEQHVDHEGYQLPNR
uniref:receptor protein-tyrosine kinase n=1 Tax=Dermatophagoides pteronyssinus TaxID=6956 RepID=A0A6P6XNN8_DERPT|nr:proto-oncogene tyrosine-protein kinase ROS-like [Dermatophagoides pteronyssinus]